MNGRPWALMPVLLMFSLFLRLFNFYCWELKKKKSNSIYLPPESTSIFQNTVVNFINHSIQDDLSNERNGKTCPTKYMKIAEQMKGRGKNIYIRPSFRIWKTKQGKQTRKRKKNNICFDWKWFSFVPSDNKWKADRKRRTWLVCMICNISGTVE